MHLFIFPCLAWVRVYHMFSETWVWDILITLKKKLGSLIVPPRTVTKQAYIVTDKEYQV